MAQGKIANSWTCVVQSRRRVPKKIRLCLLDRFAFTVPRFLFIGISSVLGFKGYDKLLECCTWSVPRLIPAHAGHQPYFRLVYHYYRCETEVPSQWLLLQAILWRLRLPTNHSLLGPRVRRRQLSRMLRVLSQPWLMVPLATRRRAPAKADLSIDVMMAAAERVAPPAGSMASGRRPAILPTGDLGGRRALTLGPLLLGMCINRTKGRAV